MFIHRTLCVSLSAEFNSYTDACNILEPDDNNNNNNNKNNNFRKCSEQLYDGKLGTGASDMYVKPFICVVGK